MKEIIQENRLIEELSEYSIRWLNVPWLNLNENTRYTHRPAVIIKEGSDFFAVRISSIKTISGNRLIDENEPMRPLRDDYEFELENWEELGLECPSYVVCDYIRRIIGITRTEFVSILPRDQIKIMQTKINNFKKDKNKNIREFESWLLYKSPFDNKYSGKMIGANLDLLNTRNNCNYLDVCTMLDSVITKSNHNEENIIVCSKFYNKDNKPKFHFYSLIINYNGINSFRIILPKNRDSLANSTVFKLDTDDLNKAIQIENEWVMENFNFRNDLETISYILTEEDKDYIKNNDTSKILKYFKEKEIFSNNNVLESSVTMRKPNEYEQKRLDIINEQMKYIYEEAKYIEKKITYGDIVKDIEWFYDGEVPNGAYKIDGQYYRVRVETIVKREINGTPHVFFEKKDKPTHYGTMYKLPGGSVEPNKNLQEQAESEVNEEILCKVKNIRYTGKHYIVKYDPKDIPEWHKRILWPMGLKYVGAITFVFTAEYGGPYRKKVEEVDKDSLAQKGKWYPIWDFEELKSDVHQGITLEAMEVVEESLMNKKNIIPLDLDNFDIPLNERVLCLNTHIVNITIAHIGYFKSLMDESKKKYGSLFGYLFTIPNFVKLISEGIEGFRVLKDQIDAVDFITFKKEGKKETVTNNLNGCSVLACNDGKVVGIITKDGKFNGTFDFYNNDTKDNFLIAGGNAVILEHENGSYYSLYCHMKDNSVTVTTGDKVHRGQIIGKVGNTGNSSGDHLHFELFYNSKVFGMLPKQRKNFEPHYCTKCEADFNPNNETKDFYKPTELNDSGELYWCCFLTDPPDKKVTEMLEVIEESTKEFKSSKVKNFEEFCKECKTPEDALNWFIAQKVVWTERANEENFRWPDQLIKERKGNCFDQSVFMHFFFEKKHIEHRMALFTIRTENGKQAGHIFPLYRKGKYIYAWLYIGPGMGIISGPYKDYDEAAERVTDFYKVLLLSGKKHFNSPISDETEWSVQDYEETKHFDEYLNKSIRQRDYMNDRGGDNLWSTHFCSKDFYFIRIPKINAIMAKLMYLTKEKMKNKPVKEAFEIVQPTTQDIEDENIIKNTFSEKEKLWWNCGNNKENSDETNALVFRRIIYDGKTPCGFVHMTDSGKLGLAEGDLNISIAVHKQYRGQGLAVKLIKEAIRWFKNSEYTTISFIVRKGNIASYRLAEKCGFVFMQYWEKTQEYWFMITNPNRLKSIGESVNLANPVKEALEYIKESAVPVTEDHPDVINDYAIEDLNESTVKKYKPAYQGLRHIRCGDDYHGKIIIDISEVVGFVNVRKSDGMIQALEVNIEYREHGIGTLLLNIAIKLGATQLTVNVNNEVAHNMYLKNGWKDTKIIGKMQYMTYGIVKEALEVVNEKYFTKYESDIKFRKFKDFKEFCMYVNTPDEVAEWYMQSGIEWPKDQHDSDCPFYWPDDIIQKKQGNCYDHALFMCYFCHLKGIEHYMHFIGSLRNIDGKWEDSGHVRAIFKKSDGYYFFEPNMTGRNKKDRCIFGPFESVKELIEFCKEICRYGTELMTGSKCNIRSFICNEKELMVLYNSIGKPIKSRDKFSDKYLHRLDDPKYYEKPSELQKLYGKKVDHKYDLGTIHQISNLLMLNFDFLKVRFRKKWSGLKNNISKLTESVEEPSDNMVTNSGIVDYVLNYMRDSIDIANFSSLKSGKRFMYTKCTVMKKDIPLVLFASYCEGLTTVLKKAEVEFYFSDTRPRLSGVESAYSGIIPFADGFLVYKKFPLENSLLMNGFALVDTKGINYAETDTKDVYVNMFEILFGMRKLANALDNFYDWFIDPVTFTVLEDLNYPTDFVGLLLAGNKLLADNNFTDELDMRNYRIRNNEMAYAYAFKQIADAYSRFRMTSNNKNPEKISIPQGVVLKDIMQSQVVDDVSELSPIVEAEKARAITTKGPSGANLKEYYTMRRRCYHKSMVGHVAIAQQPDANVGITRILTIEPNLDTSRGYMTPEEDKELNDVNLFGMAEYLTPLAMNRDDQIRGSMMVKQSKHILPVENASPVLISNGSEKVLPYHLSNDFCFVAKDDGKVISKNDKTGVIIVEYKNRIGKEKRQVINANPKIVKNGAGGFYLPTKMNTDNIKSGMTFKKNDILAFNERYFSYDKYEGVRFNIGTLTKVACMSTYTNFEDGNFVTSKLSKKLGSEICMEATAIVGANSNVDFIVKQGQSVNVGDPLIIYDNSSQDASFNKMLASIGKELKEEITLLGKTPVKSKYAGVIDDIKIYTTTETKNMSPSLKKIVEAHFTKLRAQESDIKKHGTVDSSLSFNEKAEIIDGGEDGKIMGYKVGEGVLFRFFIKYVDCLDIGDKLVHFTAMKYVNGELIKPGLEPYSIDRPEEEISSTFSPAGVCARMTPSIFTTIYVNKIIVELKRRWLEMYQKDNPKFKPKEELY